MSPKTGARVVGYVRVSSVGDRNVASESYHTERDQRREIQEWARYRGANVVDWQVDRNVSGSKKAKDRPGLSRAIERVRCGEADGVVTAKLDRFSRGGVRDALETVEAIEAAGGFWVCRHPEIDMTDEIAGPLIRDLFFSIAAMEWRRSRKMFADKLGAAAGRGIYVSNTTPFGYVRVDGNGEPVGPNAKAARLAVDPVEGPIVTELFRRRAAGEGWKSLVAWMRSTGTLAPARRTREYEEGETRRKVTVEQPRREWRLASVFSVISKRIYLGEVSDLRKDPETGRATVYEDAHPALTDPETWELAQSKPLPEPRKGTDSLVSGLVRCAGCRYAMIAIRPGRGSPRFRCSHGEEGCPGTVIVVESREWLTDRGGRRVVVGLDDYVRERVFRRLRRVEGEATAARAELEELNAKLAGLERRLDKHLADHETREIVGTARWRTAAEAIQADLEEVADRRDQVLRTALSPLGERSVLDLERDWPTMTLEERRSLLAALVQAVFVRRAPEDDEELTSCPICGRRPRDVRRHMQREHGVRRDARYGASAERVHIAWWDDPPVELPRRGAKPQRLGRFVFPDDSDGPREVRVAAA